MGQNARREIAGLDLELEEISEVARLVALAGEWSELCDRCPWCTPFQRPEWLLPWCRHFGLDEPWALALRRADRLVGFLPLFVYSSPRSLGDDDFVEERVLAVLGTGNSDYLDAVIEPELTDDALRAFVLCLANRTGYWDCCELEDLRPNSPLLAMELPAGWVDARQPQVACPIVRLPEGGTKLRDMLSGRKVGRLRRLWRLAAQYGEARVVAANTENCREIFAALVRLHCERWSRRGFLGVLAGEENQAFHGEVVVGFMARGALALHALYVGVEIAAVCYGFYEKADAFSYLSGFDPRVARSGPGALIFAAAIEDALRRGCRNFDFLRGREPYKYSWGAEDRWSMRRHFRHSPT